MNKKNLKECRGCRGCRGYVNVCLLEPHYIDDQGNKTECPCLTCLIKGICNKSCDKIQTYYDSRNQAHYHPNSKFYVMKR